MLSAVRQILFKLRTRVLIGPNIVGAFVLCSLCLVELMKVETINSIIFPIKAKKKTARQCTDPAALQTERNRTKTIHKQKDFNQTTTKKKYTKH